MLMASRTSSSLATVSKYVCSEILLNGRSCNCAYHCVSDSEKLSQSLIDFGVLDSLTIVVDLLSVAVSSNLIGRRGTCNACFKVKRGATAIPRHQITPKYVRIKRGGRGKRQHEK